MQLITAPTRPHGSGGQGMSGGCYAVAPCNPHATMQPINSIDCGCTISTMQHAWHSYKRAALRRQVLPIAWAYLDTCVRLVSHHSSCSRHVLLQVHISAATLGMLSKRFPPCTKMQMQPPPPEATTKGR